MSQRLSLVPRFPTSTKKTENNVLTLGRHAVAVAVDVRGGGLALSVVPDHVEGDGLALVQRLEAVLLDRREMHKHVLAAIVGGDKPKTLLVVEELHGAGLRHGGRWSFLWRKQSDEQRTKVRLKKF